MSGNGARQDASKEASQAPYRFTCLNNRAKREFAVLLDDAALREKLKMLQQQPRNALKAHKTKGKLQGYWECHLEADLLMLYEIDDTKREIIVIRIGMHKDIFG
ncbi:type II toxin-antitoxin system mRNA interferase toxin, RelE/StbE family [Candidatus Woesearchaeota archaeon]|nr:type II toxin-antitoxin system mRNA interferase toxin, RelE/StbE family [Candidatus Woesearchaeota archaeon]